MSASLYRLTHGDAGRGAGTLVVRTGTRQCGGSPGPYSCAVHLSVCGGKVYDVASSGGSRITGHHRGRGSIIRKDRLDSQVGKQGNRKAGALHG